MPKIDIYLSDEDKKDSLHILGKYFTDEKEEIIRSELTRLTGRFSHDDYNINIKSLAFSVWLKKWFIARNITDFRNLISGKQLNNQRQSKLQYEKLALNESEFESILKKQVVIYSKKLAIMSILNLRAEVAKRILNLMNMVNPKSVIEFGCGEGLMLYSIINIDSNFLDDKEWTGFDYSLARSLRAKILFENFQLTKNKSIYIYNGDGKQTRHKDKEFDVATCCAVIEQLKYDKDKFLNEMSRVARYSIIQEPLYENQSIRGKIHFKRNDYVHLHRSDIEKIGKILEVKHYELNDPTYSLSTILVENH